MVSRVDSILGLNLHAPVDESEELGAENPLPNPYLHYADPVEEERPKTGKKKSSSAAPNGASSASVRPKSAARRTARDEK